MSESTLEDEEILSLRDLNSHRALMTQLNKTMTAISELMSKASAITSALSDHNQDAEAHQDIRTAIENAGSTSSTAVADAIEAHNISTTAHAKLRESVTALQEEVTALKPYIAQVVSSHDLSETAHADIREAITALQNQVGSIDLIAFSDEIKTELAKVTYDLSSELTTLSNGLTTLRSTVVDQSYNIKDLSNASEAHATHLATVAAAVVNSQEELDQAKVDLACLMAEERLLSVNVTETGAVTASCTLPLYVNKDKATGFISSCSFDSEDDVTITLTPMQGEVIIYKEGEDPATFVEEVTDDEGVVSTVPLTSRGVSGVLPGEEVYAIFDTSNAAGDIILIKATFDDATTDTHISRVFGAMIIKPFSIAGVSLTVADHVEPGKTYDVAITNILDSNNGRYTYNLTSDNEAVTFTPASDNAIFDPITMSVAEDATRGTTVTLTLTVVDKYSKAAIGDTYTTTIVINELPDVSTFTTSIPDIVVPGTKYKVSFSGIKSASGRDATYSITSAPEWITFAVTENIVAGQIFNMVVADTATRAATGTITVTTLDENDVSLAIPVSVEVNQVPESSTITANIDGTTTDGGVTLSMVLGGGYDPEDASDITYAISAESSGFIFSKTTGIEANEAVTVKIPKVGSEQIKTFYVYAVDSAGERSPTPKVINVTVTPIYVATTPEITSPLVGEQVSADGFTVAWTPFTYTADMS